MFDRNRLHIKSLAERKSKTFYYPVTPYPYKLDDKERLFVDEMVTDIKEKKKVILGFGAHFIKNKCQQYLWELLRTRSQLTSTSYINHIVTNGASTIHDFEFAYYGETEEDVRENLANGTFGLWETGEHINKAINKYVSMGYGAAIGKYLEEDVSNVQKWPAKYISLAWQCLKRDIPLSICTSIGHDIIYEHPECDGAKIGEASYIDFLKLADTLEGLTDAVVLCIGSAITVPMVMEKAFAMAKNVAPKTGTNVSCYVVDLFDEGNDWGTNEPAQDSVSYFIRPLKTFNRMFPGRCKYKKMDNRKLMFYLWKGMIGK